MTNRPVLSLNGGLGNGGLLLGTSGDKVWANKEGISHGRMVGVLATSLVSIRVCHNECGR